MSMVTMARAVALSRHGFGRVGLSRITWWVAATIAVVAAVGLGRASSATLADNAHELPRTLGLVTWLIAVPLCAIVAKGPRDRDRTNGIHALGELSGVAGRTLDVSRFVATVVEVFARMSLPLLALAVTGLVRAPSLAWGIQLLVGGLAALTTAVLLSGTALLCGYLAGPRGRRLWLALLLLPWFLSSQVPALARLSLVDAIDGLQALLLQGAA